MRKRRRNTSSPEESRSRSPPAKKPSREVRADGPAKTNGKPARATAAADKGSKAEEDLSHIHPSRRGLMAGGGAGRAKASDFM